MFRIITVVSALTLAMIGPAFSFGTNLDSKNEYSYSVWLHGIKSWTKTDIVTIKRRKYRRTRTWKQNRFGTGTIVGPNTIITAGHVMIPVLDGFTFYVVVNKGFKGERQYRVRREDVTFMPGFIEAQSDFHKAENLVRNLPDKDRKDYGCGSSFEVCETYRSTAKISVSLDIAVIHIRSRKGLEVKPVPVMLPQPIDDNLFVMTHMLRSILQIPEAKFIIAGYGAQNCKKGKLYAEKEKDCETDNKRRWGYSVANVNQTANPDTIMLIHNAQSSSPGDSGSGIIFQSNLGQPMYIGDIGTAATGMTTFFPPVARFLYKHLPNSSIIFEGKMPELQAQSTLPKGWEIRPVPGLREFIRPPLKLPKFKKMVVPKIVQLKVPTEFPERSPVPLPHSRPREVSHTRVSP
jgi:hypothetical protein